MPGLTVLYFINIGFFIGFENQKKGFKRFFRYKKYRLFIGL